MKLFDFENNKLTIYQPTVLLIKEFRDVWEMDKSKNKDTAFKMFAYAYLLCDWQSPLKDMEDSERKEFALIDSELSPRKLENAVLQKMIDRYWQLQNTNITIRMIEKMRISIESFMKYFEVVDFTKTIQEGSAKGQLLHDPKKYLDVMAKAREIILTLKELDKFAKEEQAQEEKAARGGVSKGFFN